MFNSKEEDDYIRRLFNQALNEAASEKQKINKESLPPTAEEFLYGKKQAEKITKKKETKKDPSENKNAKEIVLIETNTYRIVRYKGKPLPVYEVKHSHLSEQAKKTYQELHKAFLDEVNLQAATEKDKELAKMFLINKLKELKVNLSSGERDYIINLIIAKAFGYGILQPFVDDDDLEEIMVIGLNKPVYVYHRKHYMCETNIMFTEENEKELLNIIEKIAMESGRRIDQQSPLLDARLKDGSRVNATLPPISLNGPTLTIRKFKKDPLTIIDLIKFRSVSVDIAALLWLAVDGLGARPANILIAGGTGSGKTTLLNSLSLFIPPSQRVITIEDTAELQLVVDHWVRFETRPPNIEGKGEITMDDLVKNTLRMRPDRIIVGEVRGPEAKTMFTAMNTGHDGCMGTVHSNSARDTITRLISPPMNVPLIMLPALDFIIMQNRFHNRISGTVRRVTEIAEVTGVENEKPTLSTIYTYDARTDEMRYTGVPLRYLDTLGRMTGESRRNLEVDIETRAIILDYLVAKNTRQIEEVGKYIHWFYMDKQGLIEHIEKEVEEHPEIFGDSLGQKQKGI